MTRLALRVEFVAAARRRWGALDVALVVVMLAALLAAAWFAQRAVDEIVRARQQAEAQARNVERLAAARRQALVRDPRSAVADQTADRLVQRLERDWTGLLDVLASAARPQVALIAMQPAVQTGSLQLVAEAADLDQMIDYVAALQSDARLSDVALLSHERSRQTAGNPVRFQVQAQWSGAR